MHSWLKIRSRPHLFPLLPLDQGVWEGGEVEDGGGVGGNFRDLPFSGFGFGVRVGMCVGMYGMAWERVSSMIVCGWIGFAGLGWAKVRMVWFGSLMQVWNHFLRDIRKYGNGVGQIQHSILQVNISIDNELIYSLIVKGRWCTHGTVFAVL